MTAGLSLSSLSSSTRATGDFRSAPVPGPAAPDRGWRIAVVGSGISGLGAAHALAPRHRVTLFEAEKRLGGHTHTVLATVDGITHPVDTGFLVFNERTYPQLIELFRRLSIPTAASEMSFSVSVQPQDFEWCGSSLATLFAQPRNALSPAFWSMLRDILRFNRQAGALAPPNGSAHSPALAAQDEAEGLTPLGVWLDRHQYGPAFRHHYLLPMAAAIWSCPMQQMLSFPVRSFATFCQNHGLLQVANRPRWYTVPGGARQYVERIAAGLHEVRTDTPVRSVRALGGLVQVTTDRGTETFDQLVLATHSDQSLRILADASEAERRMLQSIRYQPNRAYLHTDLALMPRRRRAWAAWNYLSNGDPLAPAVSVSYWLNRLQPLPFKTPLMVTLNPLHVPDPAHTLAEFEYAHPAFDQAALLAQRDCAGLQGRRGVWFAGAWTGYGFHEDGLKSGLAAAAGIESAYLLNPSPARAA